MISAKDLRELSSSLNILYAEDEQIIRDGMQSTLQKFFKNTFVATHGQEAFEIFKKEDIDIILTDVNMPIMDGIELIAQINKIENNPTIIVLSAHDESRLLQTLINLEVNNFLSKPVQKEPLMKILYKCCSIINDKKILASYSKKLEDENDAILRKNKILEHKLNQLALQINKTQNMNIIDTSKQTTSCNSYFQTILQDDRDELRDLSEELDTYITMVFQNENLNKDYIEKLSLVYKKYASILSSYTEFYEPSILLHKFADIILTLDNKFLHNINQTAVFLESFHLTLEAFRRNIFEKEARKPKFYNASLINDLQLIINFLEDKETEENEIEFF